MVQTSSEVVAIHDGLEVVQRSHAIGQLYNVCTSRRVLHVVRKIERHRGKELAHTKSRDGGRREKRVEIDKGGQERKEGERGKREREREVQKGRKK